MMETVDKITVKDKHGTIYQVIVKHQPAVGISLAFHEDITIATAISKSLHFPLHNEKEVIHFLAKLIKWKKSAIEDLKPECISYFNTT